MPSHKHLSPVLPALSIVLGLACTFAAPQEAAAQFRAYGYYGYGPYYGGGYGPDYYYDGPYRRHGYYGPDEADLGPEPYRAEPYRDADPSPAPRKKTVSPAASKPDADKTETKKNEPLTRDMIAKKVQGAGYKLIASPRHTGNIYLAWAEDSQANRRRLVFDATDGRLLENTVLGPVKPNKAASSRAE